MTADLNLAPIGNCAVTALIDAHGRMVWGCLPRVDSDPVFSNLLSGVDAGDPEARGVWSIEAARPARVSQAYLRNTPILRTEVEDETGAVFEILDFAPRQKLFGRTFRPLALARLIRPVKGSPRISIRFRPMRDWGAESAPA